MIKDFDKAYMTAAGANYEIHDFVKDTTALNVSRIINRSVFTIKATNDNPGSVEGSTIMAYLAIVI